MRVGGVLAAVVLALVALLAMALMIVALVGRGRRRAFAIGFLVPLLTYAAVHAFTGNDELEPYDKSALPTTQSFQRPYETFRSRTWIDATTQEPIPDYDPTVDPSLHSAGLNSKVGYHDSPDRVTFALLAHGLIAVSLAFVGSRFAVYIHSHDDGG